MDELPAYILDAFAVMAYIQGEPSAQRVKKILQDAKQNKCHVYISIINVGEILYNVERNKGMASAQDILTLLQGLPIEILPADNQTVLAAAHIKANYPISYADAFVVVAAQKINGIIMTGDPEFEEVTELAQIEWLKKRS
ncbi:MAG: type II toxin-antitoxin system VapC family toxin [Chloroflexi bacterium]|nr:type II toxin-antitoxin system VapC family toxin [Chloroflexota bacterium]